MVFFNKSLLFFPDITVLSLDHRGSVTLSGFGRAVKPILPKSSEKEAISRLLCGVTEVENSSKLRQPTLQDMMLSDSSLLSSNYFRIPTHIKLCCMTKFAHKPDKMLGNPIALG